MYTIIQQQFLSELRCLDKDSAWIVSSVMRKITNNKGLHKGDYDNHLLSKGKFKGCYDCHPLCNNGNKDLVLIYKIKSNKLTFVRLNTHKALGL